MAFVKRLGEAAAGRKDYALVTDASFAAATATRVYPRELPPVVYEGTPPWKADGLWPARWVLPPAGFVEPSAWVFRLVVNLSAAVVVRVHVTADERYELFLDGRRIARGPERGDRYHWYYESFDLALPAGRHVVAARVWGMGHLRPWAQAHVATGFVLYAEQAFQQLFSTGLGAWEVKPYSGITFQNAGTGLGFELGVGPVVDIDASAFDFNAIEGGGTGWHTARIGDQGVPLFNLYPFEPRHWLMPGQLLPQMARPVGAVVVRRAGNAASWEGLFRRRPQGVTVPPHATEKVLLDLRRYACVYPTVRTRGGAGGLLKLSWAEALVDPDGRKSNRDAVEGMVFKGLGDTFRPDGPARTFDTPWWRCGRFVELEVTTAGDPLTIEEVTFTETRYPLEPQSRFQSDDPSLNPLIEVGLRTLQMCAHETYMDCPYYEQLMYVGDTRLQVLLTHVITADKRLPRKALSMFNASTVNPTGMTTDAYPGSGKFIPPFALWYVSMLFDHAMYAGDPDFLRTLLPGARGVVDRWLQCRAADGLVRAPRGWNFVDWAWGGGIPPGAHDNGTGISSLLNLQLVQALNHLAQLETYLNEPELAVRFRRIAGEIADAIRQTFWNPQRRLLADDATGRHFSEHAQCLAIVSGVADEAMRATLADALFDDPNLTRCSIYFSHYLFEAAGLLRRVDQLFKRLTPWKDAVAQGFTTFPEIFGETRSDCHAWSAHPVFHLYSTVLGVRPLAMGFDRVGITPQLGPLRWAKGAVPHPAGEITVEVHRGADATRVKVGLPGPISGTLTYAGENHDLRAGSNELSFKPDV